MAKKSDLRLQRTGTVINLSSTKQEGRLGVALVQVEKQIQVEFSLELVHEKSWKLVSIIEKLKTQFPDVPFADPLFTSSMRPDGGFLSIQDARGELRPILIVEVKNQGTNDLRVAEGKSEQSKGNAIERLGKNVIGVRTALLSEGILPFICFGDGIDFAPTSSILDRVVTIAMLGPLNEIAVVNQGETGQFNRGSFFFRHALWTSDEMAEIMTEVARRSIHYYYAKHGELYFKKASGGEGAAVPPHILEIEPELPDIQ